MPKPEKIAQSPRDVAALERYAIAAVPIVREFARRVDAADTLGDAIRLHVDFIARLDSVLADTLSPKN